MTIPLAPRRWEATICGEPVPQGPSPVVKPQQDGSWPGCTPAPACRSDIHPMFQCGGAKSFVDDLGLSRGVVLSRAAASLRSVETKPFDWQICPLLDGRICLFYFFALSVLETLTIFGLSLFFVGWPPGGPLLVSTVRGASSSAGPWPWPGRE